MISALSAACGGSSAAGSTTTCAHPFPAGLLLAANESSVIRMTSAGPAGVLPGTRGVGPHLLAMSHSRCAVAIVTENDDSEGPLVVSSDRTARRLHRAAGAVNGIAWSPDDRRLAVSYQLASRSSVSVVDTASGAARQLIRNHGGPLAYRVAWLDNTTVLVARLPSGIDQVGVDGSVNSFLTAAQLGVDEIDPNTFTVDATRHRLLLRVFDGTYQRERHRRLVWVDLETRRASAATPASLTGLDAPFGASFSPDGRSLAFMVGRIGGGRYRCAIVRGDRRSYLPGNDQCDSLTWG